MVKATKLRRKIRTTTDLEQILLDGFYFEPLVRIEQTSLESIFNTLREHSSSGSMSYLPAPLPSSASDDNDSMLEKARREKAQTERALERLKKLYLFADESMDEKEYLSTYNELSEKLSELSNMIADAEESAFEKEYGETAFLTSVSSFLISHKIQSGEKIVYNNFAASTL